MTKPKIKISKSKFLWKDRKHGYCGSLEDSLQKAADSARAYGRDDSDIDIYEIIAKYAVKSETKIILLNLV
jgi:hypothetical protein